MNLGLRARIALITAAVVAFAVVALTLVASVHMLTDYARALDGRSLAIATSLRVQLERVLHFGIAIGDLTGFEEQCREAVKTYENIGNAIVATPGGTILFHNDTRRMGKKIADPGLAEALADAREATIPTSFGGVEYRSTIVPVMGRGGEHVASIVVTMPAAHLRNEIVHVALYGGATGLAVLAIGVLFVLGAVSRFVTQPLARLMQTIERIRRDEADFAEQVPPGGPGEVGVLIDGFNRMLQHIAQRDAKLVSHEKLARSEANLAHAQELARVGSCEMRVGEPDYWSGEMYRILGLDAGGGEAGFDRFMRCVHADDRAAFRAGVIALLKRGGTETFELRIVRPDGERVVVHQIEAQHDDSGRTAVVRGTVQDITERRETERKIRTLAYFDSLTGLPNRMQFREQVARALRQAGRPGAGKVAVMFLDLDRFKHINDSLGHPVGDELLKAVAARLSSCVRGGDEVGHAGGGQLMARLGGDEFTIMLTALAHEEDAARVARRIVAEMARPFSVQGHELFVTTSIGIAVHPGDGTDVDTLLKNADVAMYYAKDGGRNNYKFYSSDLNARALERLTLERDLHRALERGELLLHYQPQIDTRSGRATGVEALLRWQHPERGLVPPAQFIPIAEQTGLITPIGEWVLAEACRQAQAWREAGVGPLQVWVNVSGVQFRDGRLPSAIRAALGASGLPPQLLAIEATESIMLQNGEATLQVLRDIKSLGIHVAIDDFGTGYSSFAYLKRFPLDTLKIDGSFVRDLGTDAEDAAIVSAIIAMARALGLNVLAECVESAEQSAQLIAMGCSAMQGYYFGRPVPPAQIPALIASSGAAGCPAREPARLQRVG